MGDTISASSKGGRPSSFQPEYSEQAYKLCLLGATDADLADFFEVTEQTINNWKPQFPVFFESIKKGKRIADAEVANSLHQRAVGARWIEQQAFKVKNTTYSESGKKVSEIEEIVTIPVERAAPADPTSGIFWLKNRKSGDWRDKQEHEVSGTIKSILVPERIATERSATDVEPDF